MKKITSEIIAEFIACNSIPFKPSQIRLCIPIINRLYKKMQHNLKFDDIKVDGALILDGHHRYFSALLSGFDIKKVPGNKTTATQIYDWANVEFDDKEWDTSDKIAHLNDLDAQYNDMKLEAIEAIIEDLK